MMKVYPFYAALTCLLLFSLSGKAQIDYNKIIYPNTAEGLELSERLVQLAWINLPENRVLNNQVAIANFNENKARWNWLNKINISGNINEFNITGDEQSEFFPRYNFGVSIPLGVLVDQPMEKKIASERVIIAEELINQQKLAIRAEVLRRYQELVYRQEVLNIQLEATEDAYSNMLLIEQKFKNGEIDIEDYTKASGTYNDAVLNKLEAENDVRVAVINIEEMIGMKLEDVM